MLRGCNTYRSQQESILVGCVPLACCPFEGGVQRKGVHPDGGVSRGVCAHPLDPEVHPPRPKGTPLPGLRGTPPNGQKDTCENITLPQTSFTGGKDT